MIQLPQQGLQKPAFALSVTNRESLMIVRTVSDAVANKHLN